jgi:hypothetical protein
MSPEKDKALVEKYPLIFANRHGDPKETLMCWGFECGDGWYNIIDNLCSLIQNHINAISERRETMSRYNIMVGDAKNDDWNAFNDYYKHLKPQHREDYKERTLSAEILPIPEVIPQVVAVQIKEKFGTLRFYYEGGDEYIQGLVRMAESMSAVTCETCGAPGKTRGPGWIRTLCDFHEEEYQKRQGGND